MSQRYFQWVLGERRGEVVFFEKIIQEGDSSFIEFKDGSRINTELIAEINEDNISGKMVAEVENPHNVWGFEEEKSKDKGPRIEQDWESQIKYEVPSVDDLVHADLTSGGGNVKPHQKRKKVKLIPPRKTKNKFGKIATTDDLSSLYNESINSTPIVEQTTLASLSDTIIENTIVSNDPVYIMMDKAKKVDTEVNMTLTIQLPSKNLFDVAAESFEEGSKKSLEYIIQNIDISDIKEALKEGISEMYGVNNNIVHSGYNMFIEKEIKDNEKYRKDIINELKINDELKINIGEPIPIIEPVIGDGVAEVLEEKKNN